MIKWIVVVACMLLIHCSQDVDDRGYKVKIGDDVPSFDLELVNGDSISNADLHGKVSVLQFTASWCSVCRKEMPHLESEVHQRFKDEDFILLGVDIKEDKETIMAFIDKTGVSYPMAMDVDGSVFESFTVPKAGVTRNIVLNREGKIIFLTRLFDNVEFQRMIEIIESELGRQ